MEAHAVSEELQQVALRLPRVLLDRADAMASHMASDPVVEALVGGVRRSGVLRAALSLGMAELERRYPPPPPSAPTIPAGLWTRGDDGLWTSADSLFGAASDYVSRLPCPECNAQHSPCSFTTEAIPRFHERRLRMAGYNPPIQPSSPPDPNPEAHGWFSPSPGWWSIMPVHATVLSDALSTDCPRCGANGYPCDPMGLFHTVRLRAMGYSIPIPGEESEPRAGVWSSPSPGWWAIDENTTEYLSDRARVLAVACPHINCAAQPGTPCGPQGWFHRGRITRLGYHLPDDEAGV